MKNDNITKFGFSFERGGAHSSRTMMLEELSSLLSYVNNSNAIKKEYFRAIEYDNCLGKRSGKTRSLTARHLADLYSLDPNVTIFRALLCFWSRDSDSPPLLSLLCTIARDNIFRLSVPFIFSFAEGQAVSREALEKHIDKINPGRFSKATLKSIAQNINSTWTKSGHLIGRAKKIRSKARPTAGAVSYALFLSYLTGHRGEALFTTQYTKALDCTIERAIELAEEASRKRWIVFKRVGTIIEVLFPNLLTREEMDWIREQS
ncbi:MAG: hypothetical protein HQK77_11215 [Desulfobacterales bacterium]|nr:hypothetical protein [Desulfobacterales bacterium]